MELKLITATGNEPAGAVTLSDKCFAAEYNEALVHQVVNAYLAGGRAGSKAQKTRSEVRGGGAKPWRQKGTGRARAGTTRSPLWRGGGVTFASKPRDFRQKVNRKMYRAALRSILSELVRQGRLVAVEEFSVAQPKTRELAAKLKEMALDHVLIVSENVDQTLALAARNMVNVDTCDVDRVDPVALLYYEKILITASALKQLEENLT